MTSARVEKLLARVDHMQDTTDKLAIHLPALLKAFDEDLHPRDKGGKFSRGARAVGRGAVKTVRVAGKVVGAAAGIATAAAAAYVASQSVGSALGAIKSPAAKARAREAMIDALMVKSPEEAARALRRSTPGSAAPNWVQLVRGLVGARERELRAAPAYTRSRPTGPRVPLGKRIAILKANADPILAQLKAILAALEASEDGEE